MAILPAPGRRSVANDVSPQSALIIAVVLTNFLPAALSFPIFGLRLTVTRILLILLTPLLAVGLVAKMASGRYRFVASDLLMVVASCWMVFGSAVGLGFGEALNHAGPEVLEFLISYLVTRVLLTAPGQALSIMKVLCVAIAVIGVIATLDAATDSWFTHDLAGALTGQTVDPGRPDYRMGFRRAAGPLEHPILLGATCMIGLLVAGSMPPLIRAVTLAGSMIGLVVCVSSGPLMGVVLGFGLLFYDRLFKWLRWRWLLVFAGSATVTVMAFTFMGSPLGFINQYLVLEPASAYAREFEWSTVGVFVADAPWLGIGFGWADIAEETGAFTSIDSVWLGKALIYGIPCSVLIGLSYVGATSISVMNPSVRLTRTEVLLATQLSIIMFLLVFLGFTVYFWGSFWILSSLLAGMRAHLGELGKLPSR